MKIIFDFDDVLFDSKSLKAEIFSGLTRFGITHEFVENLYQKYRDEFNVVTLYREAFELSQVAITEEEIYSLVEGVLQDLPKYTDTRFTEIIQKVGQENCFIVTAGEEAFQKRKIKASGIMDIIASEHIIVVYRNKKENIERLCSLCPHESIIFVDDKVRHIEEALSLEMSNLFPVLYDEHGFEALEKCIAVCTHRDQALYELAQNQQGIFLRLPDDFLVY